MDYKEVLCTHLATILIFYDVKPHVPMDVQYLYSSTSALNNIVTFKYCMPLKKSIDVEN